MKTENIKYPIIGTQFYNPYRKEIGQIMLFDTVHYAQVEYFQSGDRVGHDTASVIKFMNSKKNDKELKRLQAENEKEIAIERTLAQIKKDVEDGDFTAIYELLQFCPIENLKGYLAED